jgi:outer membrane lipoprotein SlyB
MENQKTSNRIHPLIAGAAASVILVSLVGVAAITGVLPSSHGTSAPLPALSAPVGQPGYDTQANSNTNLAAQSLAAPSTQYPPAPPSPAQNQTAQYQAAAQYQEPPAPATAPARQICRNCGKVESVRIVQHQSKPSGVGVVAGAILGGVLGNQVGGGNGRSLATVAGAVGGGYAGNEIEKRSNTTSSYQVQVRMENGRIRHFSYSSQPGWHAGDRVRVVNGRLTSAA